MYVYVCVYFFLNRFSLLFVILVLSFNFIVLYFIVDYCNVGYFVFINFF